MSRQPSFPSGACPDRRNRQQPDTCAVRGRGAPSFPRRQAALLVAALLSALGIAARVQAHYAAREIETVPTARLIANLERRLAEGAKESDRFQTGEQIQIWSWKRLPCDGTYTVETNGSVDLSGIGRVAVAGRTRDELMKALNGTADTQAKDFRGIFVEQAWHQRRNRLAPGETAELHYELARVYSIAYAQQPADFMALKGGDRPFLGDGAARDLPPNRQWFRGAGPVGTRPGASPGPAGSKTNLDAAIRHFRLALSLRTNHLGSLIGLAWCQDQGGDKTAARQAYRQALERAWEIEKKREHILETSYAEEIIGYLKPLLDPAKDAAELAALAERSQAILAKPRAMTPVLFPLEPGRSFEELTEPSAAVAFDLDGSGLPRRWGWITPRAAWLVFDPAGRAEITSGLQMFGSVTFWVFWKNGYEALARLDDNGDGVLEGGELAGLAAWQDRDRDGRSDPGEVTPLGDLGVVGVSTTWRTTSTGMPFSPDGIRFRDGSTRPTFDWIMRSPGGEAASNRTPRP